MTEDQEKQAERIVDDLARKSDPSHVDKLDRQFTAKLARLEKDGHAPAEMLAHLRLFWRMFQASDDRVPWKTKALLMAGLAYFANPFDAIPDVAGKLGYLDDALVLRIIHRRLAGEIAQFEAGEADPPEPG